MRETLEVGPEQISLESHVRSLALIFKNIDIRCINNGYRLTGLDMFKSEPTLQTDLIRIAEKVMGCVKM